MRAFVRHLRPGSASKSKDMSTKNLSLLILYDIPTAKGGETWSPNVWQIRLALNYKGLPYKTEWVEYPDIGKVGKEIGAKPTTPNPDGSGVLLWTCPMLADPNQPDSNGKPTVLSESIVIMKYLDDTYPDRRAMPEGTVAFHAAWSSFMGQNVTNKLADIMLPLCPAILSPRGKEYFISTREHWWGPLDKMCPDREKAWKGVRAGLDKVASVLDRNGVEGQSLQVIPGRDSYADFVMLGPFLWAKALLGQEEMDQLKSWNDGRWGKLLEKHAELIRVQ